MRRDSCGVRLIWSTASWIDPRPRTASCHPKVLPW